jgi:hypothetical protein
MGRVRLFYFRGTFLEDHVSGKTGGGGEQENYGTDNQEKPEGAEL